MRTPRANSISGMHTPPSMFSDSSSQPGSAIPLKFTARPARLAKTMGSFRRWTRDECGSSMYRPTEKCSSISTMNSTIAAGRAASPNASTSSGIPMLPELLNIIGGRKVFRFSFSSLATGYRITPDPRTTTVAASASQPYSCKGACWSASTANTSMGTNSSMLSTFRP